MSEHGTGPDDEVTPSAAADVAATPLPARVGRILMTEEAVYGLILVSGMIVVSNSVAGTSFNALVTVFITVLVFFAAHVYAGTIARMAMSEGQLGWGRSIRIAARHSEGMLLVSVVPLVILALERPGSSTTRRRSGRRWWSTR